MILGDNLDCVEFDTQQTSAIHPTRRAMRPDGRAAGIESGRRRQMTQLLQQAFQKASELPQEEQDNFARFLLAELESERQWADLFSRPESEELLERLADEAVSEHRAGRTRPLNPEEL